MDVTSLTLSLTRVEFCNIRVLLLRCHSSVIDTATDAVVPGRRKCLFVIRHHYYRYLFSLSLSLSLFVCLCVCVCLGLSLRVCLCVQDEFLCRRLNYEHPLPRGFLLGPEFVRLISSYVVWFINSSKINRHAVLFPLTKTETEISVNGKILNPLTGTEMKTENVWKLKRNGNVKTNNGNETETELETKASPRRQCSTGRILSCAYCYTLL